MSHKCLCLTAGILICSGISFGQSTFFAPLPTVGSGLNGTIPNAVSEDGSTVVGLMGTTGYGGWEAFTWHRDTGLMSIYHNSPTIYNLEAHGVSADGSIVAGEMFTQDGWKGFSWTKDGGLVQMDGPHGAPGYCHNYGISGDGSAIVGEATDYNGAFRWTRTGGYDLLGDLPGGTPSSTAIATSHDGSVVVGYSSGGDGPFGGGADVAFRWTKSTGMESLGTLPGAIAYSRAQAVSADGDTIVGWAVRAQGSAPFYWTEATGMVDIGLPGIWSGGTAYAVSQDGALIVGEETTDWNPDGAFIYDKNHGFRWLRDVLTENGLGDQLAGWRLSRATGITVDPNGLTVITGYGVNPSGATQGFVLAVPEPSSALALGLSLGFIVLLRKRSS